MKTCRARSVRVRHQPDTEPRPAGARRHAVPERIRHQFHLRAEYAVPDEDRVPCVEWPPE